MIRVTEAELRESLARGLEIRGPSDQLRILSAELLRLVLVARPVIDPRGLLLDGLTIEGPVDLARMSLPRISARMCTFWGPVDLSGSRVEGRLNLEGSRLLGVDAHGYSLTMYKTATAGACTVSDTDSFPALTSRGSISLLSADISGALIMRGAKVDGSTPTTGFGVLADMVHVQGPLYGESMHLAGSLSLVAASVESQVNISRSVIKGTTGLGCSVQADSISVRGPFYSEGLRASGAISVVSAELGDEFSICDSEVSGLQSGGFGVVADYVAIAESAIFRGVTSTGGVALRSARIGGSVDMRGLVVANRKGASLELARTQAGEIRLDKSLGTAPRLDLDGIQVRRLELDAQASQLPRLEALYSWNVETFVGSLIQTRMELAEWLTHDYRGTQPWFELAAFLDRVGRPGDAKWFRYQTAGLTTDAARKDGKRAQWLLRKLYRTTTGYGYYPLLTLGWLVAIFVAATGIAATQESQFSVPTSTFMRSQLAESLEPGVSIPGRLSAHACVQGEWDVNCISPVAVGISTAIPVTALEQPWQPAPGAVSFIFGVLRALAWVLTVLFVAGFTGLLKRTSA